MAGEVAGQEFAGRAAANDEDAGGVDGRHTAVFEDAVDEAVAGEQRKQEHGVEERHRAR